MGEAAIYGLGVDQVGDVNESRNARRSICVKAVFNGMPDWEKCEKILKLKMIAQSSVD
jgi:hypothetical protein